jgi:glycosyltransferase involved in cell wall biosynthesis
MIKNKTITIFTPCYNEEKNIDALYARVCSVIDKIPNYNFEYVLIDNASTDNTVARLKEIAEHDKRIKVISNVRNFGHIRSPYYGLLQCTGDAVIAMVADLQDPPEMIPKYIEEWEKGHALVLGIKTQSKENPLMFLVRKLFYSIIR